MRRHLLVSTLALAVMSEGISAQTTTPSNDDAIKAQQLRQITLTNDALEQTAATAKAQALANALPAGSTTGAVTTKDGAGQAEASALATRTLGPLADFIAERALAAAQNAGTGPGSASTNACSPGGSDEPPPVGPSQRPSGHQQQPTIAVTSTVPPLQRTPPVPPVSTTAPPLPAPPVDEGSSAPPPAISADTTSDTTGGAVIQRGLAGDAAILPILLTSGSDQLSFAHWDQFRFRYCKIKKDYDTALTAANAALLGASPPKGGFAPAMAEAAVSAAVKLAQLVTPDWEVSNLTTTVTNRPLLLQVGRAYSEASRHPCPPKTDLEARDVATAAPKCQTGVEAAVYWQGATGRLDASAAIFGALDILTTVNTTAQPLLAKITKLLPDDTAPTTTGAAPPATNATKSRVASATASSTLATKPKPKAKPKATAPAQTAAVLQKLKDAKSQLDDVIAAHAQLLKDLASTDATSPLPLGTVISESSAATILGTGGLVLNVNVDSSGGTGLARKVIWNVFSPGSPAFYVSGTTSVSYALVRPSDQRLLSSGSFSCSTGPIRLRNIPYVLSLSGHTLTCDLAR